MQKYKLNIGEKTKQNESEYLTFSNDETTIDKRDNCNSK